MIVKDLLNRKGNAAISINPDCTVFEALQLMAAKDIGAVLAIENDELRGIFSERDHARKLALNGKSELTTPIRDVMVTKLTSVTPEDLVRDCMELMTERHIRHLPVFDKDTLIGVISIGDVVKGMIDDQKDTITHLEKYISGAMA